jgi:aspartyl/asparaginyl-tRNA synthetase
VAAALTLLLACTKTTTVREITDNPRDYAGKQVTVMGEVTEVYSLFVVKYFEVDDGTGTLSVLSSKPLPNKGQRIKVTGTLQEAFSLGDKTMTVLLEDQPEQDDKNRPGN